MSLTRCPNCADQHVCHSGDSHKATQATEDILMYIGWRAGRASQLLPMRVRPSDIQVPARHIIALIEGSMTLDEVVLDAELDL